MVIVGLSVKVSDRLISWADGKAWVTRSGSVQCVMPRRLVRRLQAKPTRLRWRLYASGKIAVEVLPNGDFS